MAPDTKLNRDPAQGAASNLVLAVEDSITTCLHGGASLARGDARLADMAARLVIGRDSASILANLSELLARCYRHAAGADLLDAAAHTAILRASIAQPTEGRGDLAGVGSSRPNTTPLQELELRPLLRLLTSHKRERDHYSSPTLASTVLQDAIDSGAIWDLRISEPLLEALANEAIADQIETQILPQWGPTLTDSLLRGLRIRNGDTGAARRLVYLLSHGHPEAERLLANALAQGSDELRVALSEQLVDLRPGIARQAASDWLAGATQRRQDLWDEEDRYSNGPRPADHKVYLATLDAFREADRRLHELTARGARVFYRIKDDQALPAFIEALNDGAVQDAIWGEVGTLLSTWPGTTADDLLCTVLDQNISSGHSGIATQIISALGTRKAKTGAPRLLELWQGNRAGCRVSTLAWALLELDVPECNAVLADALYDEAPDVRDAAISAILRMPAGDAYEQFQAAFQPQQLRTIPGLYTATVILREVGRQGRYTPADARWPSLVHDLLRGRRFEALMHAYALARSSRYLRELGQQPLVTQAAYALWRQGPFSVIGRYWSSDRVVDRLFAIWAELHEQQTDRFCDDMAAGLAKAAPAATWRALEAPMSHDGQLCFAYVSSLYSAGPRVAYEKLGPLIEAFLAAEPPAPLEEIFPVLHSLPFTFMAEPEWHRATRRLFRKTILAYSAAQLDYPYGHLLNLIALLTAGPASLPVPELLALYAKLDQSAGPLHHEVRRTLVNLGLAEPLPSLKEWAAKHDLEPDELAFVKTVSASSRGVGGDVT